MTNKTALSPDTLPARKTALITFLSLLFREKKLGAIGLIIVVVFFLAGIFADLLAPYGMMEFDMKKYLRYLVLRLHSQYGYFEKKKYIKL